MAADAAVTPVERRPSVLADYWEMTKPSITLLVLVTTAGAMVWAAGGLPPIELTLATIIGLACASGGGAVLNHVLDRDIDRLMERTRRRPVAVGRVSVAAATAFGLGLNVVAAAILLEFTNVLTTVFAIGGSAFYVVIYTMVLKRRTPQNIVIGGAAGAIPPLAGWAAVTGEVGLAPLIMFLIIFLWTPPHFWALAILKKDEYARAGIPMLPAVATERETAVQILAYTVILAVVSLIPVATGLLGVLYAVAAIGLGGRFIWLARRLLLTHSPLAARATFLYSLLYLALLFAAMGADRAIAAI
ncbi:MAG: heme o synthase [Gaiellaceae bacterium]|nr:heme o synthase [Gaiellaceae bacterium]